MQHCWQVHRRCDLLARTTPTRRSGCSINRWSEDYSDLGLRRGALDFWERLKFRPLNDSGTVYLSFGGEARIRLDAYSGPNFGRGLAGKSDFLQTTLRVLQHADLHIGGNARAFVQFGTYGQSGRKPSGRPLDQADLALAQAFFDVSAGSDVGGAFMVRAGRQTVAFGRSRLFSIRDATARQRSFDGVRLTFSSPGLVADAFYLAPVNLREGVFRDVTARDEPTCTACM